MRILLIEDDDQKRQLLMDRLMTEEDVETVYQASDFGSALDFIPDADGIVCDDSFPFVAGEPPFQFAWMGIKDAAREQRKPFVLIAGDTRMWLEASRQNVDAYRKNHAAEAIVHLVRALNKNLPAAPESSFGNFEFSPGYHQPCPISC